MAGKAEAYTLNLGEGVLSCGLGLMRGLMDPRAKSAPHVTVRYSSVPASRSQQQKYFQASIDDLTLAEPMAFSRSGDTVSTLVFICVSEQLESHIYKPDFFETVSHCTVYDGSASTFALEALRVLTNHVWGLCFPRGLRIERHQRATPPHAQALNRGMEDLWHRLWPEEDIKGITSLVPEARLQHLDELCRYLMAHVPRRTASPSEALEADALPATPWVQPSLFPELASDDERLRSPERQGELRRSGTVATPPEVAAAIVHHVNALRSSRFHDGKPISFGDPAIGGGVFYASVARLREPIKKAIGIEISEPRAQRTRSAFRGSPLRVIHGDFLSMPPNPEQGFWNFVTANPPYRRSQELPDSARTVRRELEQSLRLSISERADLYIYFILAADAWMERDACAGWLIPSSFMVTKAGSALRTYLTNNVDLIQVHSFGNGQDSMFQDVAVSSCAIFFAKRGPNISGKTRFTEGAEISAPDTSFFVPTDDLRRLTRWGMSELRPGEGGDGNVVRVGHLFDIHRGIATGANAFFVLGPEQAVKLSIPDDYLKDVITRAHLLPQDGVIPADDDGRPVTEGVKRLIDTTASMDVIRSVSPPFAEYLSRSSVDLSRRALVARRSPFYSQQTQDSPPFLFTYMAKAKSMEGNDRFFLNQSSARVLNNFLVLEPKAEVRDQLETHPDLAIDMLRALRGIPQEVLVAYGRSYRAGLVKLEPSDLRRVPVSGWRLSPYY
jgi:hypothetical protein